MMLHQDQLVWFLKSSQDPYIQDETTWKWTQQQQNTSNEEVMKTQQPSSTVRNDAHPSKAAFFGAFVLKNRSGSFFSLQQKQEIAFFQLIVDSFSLRKVNNCVILN